MLFKEFGGVDAFPICLNTKDPDEIVRTVKAIAPAFGGINLEDISAPRCFQIEERLKEELDIPVFHDDQHGTAVVVLAALINALKLVGKRMEEVKVIVNGTGAAGVACTEIMPEEAAPHVAVMATGRSDYPNQINNVLCFPGIFRGALGCRASRINEEMKVAASHAIAGIITDAELHPEYIIPSVFDKRVAEAVARAVEEAAYETGVARRERVSTDLTT